MVNTAQEFEERFNAGEDMGGFLEPIPSRKVQVDFPEPMLDRLDREAKRLGIARTALIKVWIDEKFDEKKKA